MRVTFLGTAAAEGYPNPFCGCENCRAARRAGGRSLRKRAAALINDDLLLDLGPDLISASFHGVSN
ncbi:MAG: MBL fold metallo-hydrolase, partial [bacterium]